MPIRPENRRRYPANWREIAAAIRARADDKCEFCGAPDSEEIVRCRADPVEWITFEDFLGRAYLDEAEYRYWRRPILVVLTVAHLDHHQENCDPSNLRALCQRCHLICDREQHAATARATARATRRPRLAVRDLFGGEA